MDTPDSNTTKQCSKCGAVKQITDFRKGKLQCLECIRERDREYRLANAERLREYQREYYATNAEKKRKYRIDKAEHIRRSKREYRAANAEHIRAYLREYAHDYYIKNAERLREHRRSEVGKAVEKAARQRRHARKVGLLDTFTATDWQIALDYFGGCCAACGRPRGLWHTMATDHWMPLSKGGPTTPGNIVPLCHGVGGCNNSKADRDPIEWLLDKFGKRNGRAIQQRIEAYLNSRRKEGETI